MLEVEPSGQCGRMAIRSGEWTSRSINLPGTSSVYRKQSDISHG